MHLLKKKISTI